MYKTISKEEILNCRHGISSYFFPVDDYNGIKFFRSRSERDKSKFRQNIASLSGLAPKVGSNYDTDDFFGYYTEKVVMLHDCYSFKEIPSKIKKQMYNLERDLSESCDFEIDTNWQNYGFNSCGQIVCVDFGDIK